MSHAQEGLRVAAAAGCCSYPEWGVCIQVRIGFISIRYASRPRRASSCCSCWLLSIPRVGGLHSSPNGIHFSKIWTGLVWTIHRRCIYGISGREITKYPVMYGASIGFWPTLDMNRVGQNCIHTPYLTVHM